MPTTISSLMTKTQMLNVVDANMPNQFFAICVEDGFIYKYDKANTADAEIGKFRKSTSGGTDIINIAGIMMGNYADHETIIHDNRELNDLTDVEVASPTNGQVLKYDGTTNTWTNGEDTGGSGGASTVLTETLSAGSTSVTFTDIPTTGNYLVDFYTSSGINYNAIDTSTAGQVTLTFAEQIASVEVSCEIKEVPSSNE